MIKFTKNIRDFNKKMNNEKNNKRERKNDISKNIQIKRYFFKEKRPFNVTICLLNGLKEKLFSHFN